MSVSDPRPVSPETTRTRRLAAIAFLDVVDFSHMVQSDEEGTLHRWKRLLDEAIVPDVASNDGRVVQQQGDGLLIEFQSAVNAVRWALELQRRLGLAVVEAAERISLRIAVHLGDVVVERNSIFGDGVNVAARLQEHAPRGGIALSAAVHELVCHALSFDTEDLGPLQLKNISSPVRAYAIPPFGKAEERRPAALPSHRPSIAVLPFRVVGPEKIEDYFVEGLTHEIVASLAAFRELFVLSSNTTLRAADGRGAGPDEIGPRFNIRYIASGTATRRGNDLHLSVELTDNDSRHTIWSGRYKATVDDLPTAQDEAATRIACLLLPHLRQSELTRALRKPPANWDAYDLTLQALHRLYSFDPADHAEASRLLRRAVERDPNFAMSYALLAHWYVLEVGEGRSKDGGDSEQAAAARYSALALERDASDPLALAIHGHCAAFVMRDLGRAVEAFDRALSCSPNSPIVWGMSSPTYAYLGDGPTAVARAEYALRLSPLDPSVHMFEAYLGLAHYVNGSHEEAVHWSRRALAASPKFVAVLRHLITSLVALDRIDEARAAADRLMALVPNFRVRPFVENYPLADPARRARYAHELLAAGLPE